MPDTTSNNSADYVLLTRLADEFAARYRAGERPSLQVYVDRHPELADDIRELFPAMVEMELVKGDHQEAADQAAVPVASALRQLGDFRILREVGNGGMGIVYEAEQVSLGRHVALKLLPKNMLLDVQAKRRFEREAKSAAKLHHTNIVPVFGVGEQDGMPYYVMQFIQGLGLDDVLEEVKNLQASGAKAGTYLGGDAARLRAQRGAGLRWAQRSTRSEIPNPRQRRFRAANVARSLLTGTLHSPLDRDEATATATVEEPGGEGAPVTVEGEGERDPDQATLRSPAAFSIRSTLSSSSVLLPGQGRDGSTSRNKKRTYWQGVATIGVQVAEGARVRCTSAGDSAPRHQAIEPAPGRAGNGVGHRFWTGQGRRSTKTSRTPGDMLGTLRYMPPEALEGQDRRPQ